MIRNFAHRVNRQKVILGYEIGGLERETGLEPATACLEGRNSTTELLPLESLSFYLWIKPLSKSMYLVCY